MAAQRFKQTSAAEIMCAAGHKIICKTVACIEMRRIRLIGSVDRDKDSFTVKVTLYDALLVRQDRDFEITVAERFAFTVCVRKSADQLGKLGFLRLIKAGTQRRITLILVCLCAPFTAVIDAGYTWHTEQHSIYKRQMCRI